MRKLLLPFVLFLSGCALLQTRVPVVEWPENVTFLQGEGDIEARWHGEKSSATFALRMEYPDSLLFEAYGSPFGQTLLHVEKKGGKLLVIAGSKKTTDETAFKEKYGFGVEELMNALAMKGQKEETPEGLLVRERGYSVLYGDDRRGRKTMCLEKRDDSICLAFSQIAFTDR
jgi:hypothetical protein